MDILATLFPSAFPALALSHFVALLSPGPDFFLLVGYAIRYRLRGSVGLCIGIAAGNGLYIILAVIGWGILRHAPLLFTVIELLGAAYLLWIGSLLIRSRPTTLALDGAPVSRPNVTLVQQAVSGAWMTSVVLIWDLLLVTLIALPSVQRRLSAVVWRVERTAGAILMAFGGWIVWQFLHEAV